MSSADPVLSKSLFYLHGHHGMKPGWNKKKPIFGDQSMSSKIARTKDNSLQTTALQHHNHPSKGGFDHHARDSALHRIRSGGSVVPAKCHVSTLPPMIPRIPMPIVTYNPGNTINNALARVRGGGCSTCRCYDQFPTKK